MPQDIQSSSRKKDHISLALDAQVSAMRQDQRFVYEPMLAAHPSAPPECVTFAGKELKAPIWISSMTGGTAEAGTINRRLARACGEFGLGMGLGSCRSLLESEDRLPDFDMRPEMGDHAVLMANLGIAQIEDLIKSQSLEKTAWLVHRLQADGLIVHVNPLQEWLQPEGDRFEKPALETLQTLVEFADFPVVVKEVGQGMGPESLRALFAMPLAAVDFAAHGGTNFSRVELLRSSGQQMKSYESLVNIGHSADEMAKWTNDILTDPDSDIRCNFVIASGGVRNFLDGYYFIKTLNCRALYGQGTAFLVPARDSYETLSAYIRTQIEGFRLANAFLRLKTG